MKSEGYGATDSALLECDLIPYIREDLLADCISGAMLALVQPVVS
jgi:hypothetical protein